MADAGTRSSTDPEIPDSPDIPDGMVENRSDLLPEELAVGSDDPQAQAEAILEESEERVTDPDAGI
ncbi:hypothetical protein ACVBEQ_19680 [Nakamurella sp. GG22]